ncbi:class I SAM-dependent methyltransferase [Castellaniella sp. GW247-6E4]|uniref:class I SAM-dependent methyltransferase n=1 Tax=Castellaniella sp. GW247-6E4 TaxID=3140380 RepID=UPI0033155C6A
MNSTQDTRADRPFDDPDSASTGLSDANQGLAEDYDRQVYTSNAFWYAAPGHLRAAAHLYGLEAPTLEHARVLELGCAGGGNVLPFALTHPGAQVVGVDLSPVQIAHGQGLIDTLGLKNLQLRAMSLTDITPDFGQFDYIIAHGVFSWVPHEVREAMMRILRDNLAPDGVGYISYNTYPGWKAGDIVRDAMLLHSHSVARDEDRLPAAKAMLNLLSEGIAPSNPLASSLRAAVQQLRQQSDYYIAHEHLETYNNPCYLLEFVSLADQFGLTHVGDAEAQSELGETYGAQTRLNHNLVALGQPREMRQQYLDFAVGRNFRKSLLVHQARAGDLSAAPLMERLGDLRWAGSFIETEPPAQAPAGVRFFRNHRQHPLHSNDATILSVIQTLSRHWPSSLTTDELLDNMRADLPESPEAAREALQTALRTLFRLNMLCYLLTPSPYDATKAADEAEPPRLIPGFQVIFEAQRDPAFGVGIFTLWHETVNLQLKDAEAWLLPHIDGRHSRKQLATILRDALSQGIVPDNDGRSLKGQRNLDQKAGTLVKNLLDLLQRLALLQ